METGGPELGHEQAEPRMATLDKRVLAACLPTPAFPAEIGGRRETGPTDAGSIPVDRQGPKLSPTGYRPFGFLMGIPSDGDPARRRAARSRALAASTSRFLGGAAVTRESTSIRVSTAICSTARSKAARLAFDGRGVPAILRTYCRAAAWTSSSVAGGSKLWRVRILRHMAQEVNEGSERTSLGVGNHLGTVRTGHDQQMLVIG